MKNKNFLIIALFATSIGLNAQHKLNFGLQQKQEKNELPVSKAAITPTVLKEKVDKKGVLSPLGNKQYQLTEGWEMQEANVVLASGKSVFEMAGNRDGWYNATVPGTVLTTLVEQGVYPDPYFGLNNLQIPDDLCRKNWWYRINFDYPQQLLKGESAHLLFNGINYKADVWLNNKLVGNISGAFIRGNFDITDMLKEKNNVLAVHIYPPNNPGIPHEENKDWFGPNGGALCLDGPTFISSEGWDWIPGIRDRNIGIWQDVVLSFGRNMSIENPKVITDLALPDTTVAKITVDTDIYNSSAEARIVKLQAKIENIVVQKSIEILGGERKTISFSPEEFKELIMKNPKLWWPNGYGKQHLYNLDLILSEAGEVIENKTVRFGVRELSYELAIDTDDRKILRVGYSPTDVKQKGVPLFDFTKRRSLTDEGYKGTEIASLRKNISLDNFYKIEASENPFLVIRVNGQPIFCKGGNWGMDDGMKRVSRERLEPYIRLHKEENFNMIRNWTGESTEKVFYDLCDEYGMLVWNDFSISTEFYNLNPLDEELFMANATDIIKRFRNHPSIAIWCPRNEGYAPKDLENRFQYLIASEDGTRHYHGNSREMNLRGSGPWHYIKNPKTYYTDFADGFNSELGTPSVPTYSTLKKFIAEEDIWPIGDVWYYHDLHLESFEWKDYIEAVNKMGALPAKNAEEFCRRAQVVNYNSHKFMFEAWNHKMWNSASGMLLWMSHPAWASMIWQTYSYDYETHGSFYGSKKACEPIHIQWNLNDKKLVAVNTTLKSYKNARASLSVYSQYGEKLFNKQLRLNISANNITNSDAIQISDNIDELVLVRLELKDANDQLLSVNDYWYDKGVQNAPNALVNIETSKLRIDNIKKNIHKNKVTFNIINTSKSIGSFIKLNIANAYSGEIILPIYTSDGYFNLLPNESKMIEIEIPNRNVKDLKLLIEQLSGDQTEFKL